MTIRKEEKEHEISFDAGNQEKMGLSKRRIAVLCAEGHIPNVQKAGNTWLIPENAKNHQMPESKVANI